MNKIFTTWFQEKTCNFIAENEIDYFLENSVPLELVDHDTTTGIKTYTKTDDQDQDFRMYVNAAYRRVQVEIDGENVFVDGVNLLDLREEVNRAVEKQVKRLEEMNKGIF